MDNEPLDPFVVEGALLLYAGNKWHDPYWYQWDCTDRTGEEHEIPGLGTVKVVACNLPKDISYAEHSEEVWMVFDVRGTLYRKSGTHTSYIGTDWADGMQIVKARTKTVTYYEED